MLVQSEARRCKRCPRSRLFGIPVVPFVTSTIEGHLYAVVNVHAFDHIEQSMLKHSAVTFDGEDEGARLARRAKNWIAAIDIV